MNNPEINENQKLSFTEINDWDYFLPRNHQDYTVENQRYRIFEKEFEEDFLLWMGREDIDKNEKKSLIEKLVDFNKGCHGYFYRYHAYFKKCYISNILSHIGVY